MISGNLKKEFETLLGEKNVMGDEVTRMNYAYDGAVLDPVMPSLVLRPDTSEQLGQAIRLCGENGIPVTVRGAGTNLSGGTIPYKNGVVMLTNAMNKIIEINESKEAKA